MLFVQLLANGLQTGALYALIAAGFSLIFGMTRVFHAAHGATFTIAGFIFYEFYAVLDWAWPLAALASAAAAGLFGVLLDRYVYAVIQRHEGSFFTVFVASFGAAIVVQNVISIVFGRGMVTVSTPLSKSLEIVPGLFIAPIAIAVFACAIVSFALLQWLLTRTNLGIALRALGENPALIEVYGLTPRRLSQYVFLIGSILVVPAAILTAATSGLNPAMGHHIMLISIAATIVGGVGSLRGAAVAGLLLGLAENLCLAFIDPQWSEAVTFVILFLFILFRPGGVYGRATVS
ncbi:MAG: branched-chain amino acid ABC transporter permease [Burkholderiaceae bacterium]|jgi:branched-chain amino acid transport system permease protein|nr:branched-chain amino acid ABC transporter permease [Burkholderiaceae bacterium]MDP4969047.1 branched-chain amino acid ABC transporter permease [Burkholderiaceae bacterium]MDP5111080.1 branched-chain amino acid ABC transporter permease [Burkholderiaceae bacterium]